MKKPLVLLALLAFALAAAGCSKPQKLTAPTEHAGPASGAFAPGFQKVTSFYTWASSHDPAQGFVDLERIDLATGQGTIVAYLNGIDLTGADPRGLATPLGLAFDGRGQMYTIIDWLFGPEPVSQLGRVDLASGTITMIGPMHAGNMAGPAFDRKGDMYAIGFSNGPNHEPPDWFIGDRYLYRFNKYTGEAVRIGDTGLRDVMDLAFDASGRLYGTTMNQLFVINTANGNSRKVADLSGVPINACGIQLEVMSIGFAPDGTLYGSAIEGFANDCYTDTPFLKIDPRTGRCEVIGWTGQWYNHGGAILTQRVPI